MHYHQPGEPKSLLGSGFSNLLSRRPCTHRSLNGWIVGCLGPVPVARKYRKEALNRRKISRLFKAHENPAQRRHFARCRDTSMVACVNLRFTVFSRLHKTPLQQKRPRILRFMSINQELMPIEAEHHEVLEAAVATKLRLTAKPRNSQPQTSRRPKSWIQATSALDLSRRCCKVARAEQPQGL